MKICRIPTRRTPRRYGLQAAVPSFGPWPDCYDARSSPSSPGEAAWIAENRGLVGFVVRKFTPRVSTSEAISFAYPMLQYIYRTYDPGKAKISTYAVRCLRHFFWRYRKGHGLLELPKRGRRGKGPPLNPRLLGDTVDLCDCTVPDSSELECEQHALVRRCFDVLSERDRDVLAGLLGLDGSRETLAQLGLRWGISRSRIHELGKRALMRLKAKHHEFSDL